MERTPRKSLSTLTLGFIGLAAVAAMFIAPLAVVMVGVPSQTILFADNAGL